MVIEAETRMRESLRKLAIWHTKTFKPITTHDELETIMDTLGFSTLPNSDGGWKEYIYAGSARRRRDHHQQTEQPPPRPRLTYPKTDGLHTYTYQAFIDAVNFHLEMANISDLFHIRGLPLQRSDLYKKWRKMQEDDSESNFVYREGTLDRSTYNRYHFNKNADQSEAAFLRRGSSSPPGCLVPLKDITL